MGKSRVKSRASDQSWEEEEMMYEINRRNLKRQKRKLEASKVTPEQKEEKRLERKREKWMMEERKIFLGGLADDIGKKQ